ncbi:hypothetical protein RJ639_003783 [Escallonia herrerae]|uniref:Uncharacterized protein n=1 Tax=Escallonia herrerae TaxID=1293975 RepID=A0AA88W270_9ASTE|nr:hypothetical protein RJ639_003783 [Escallonia herrerae]
MDFVYILTFICLFNLHPSIAQNSTVSWAGDAEESLSTIIADEETKFRTYIVHVSIPDGQTFTESETLDSWYNSFLPTTTSGLNDQSRMVHMYRNVVSGFAARLSPEEVKAMEKKDGFVSARPQRTLSLHTTHTPNFLGLHQNLGFWKGSNYGKGVIIGLMDSGITPNHPSFSDDGVPPPPRKWKGKCQLKGKACQNGDQNAAWCADGSLKNADVKGKVVLCQRGGGIARLAKGQTVKDAGGAAMILMNQEPDGDSTLADPHSSIPEAELNYPSFAITLGTTSQTYTRTVTNVGEANASYTVEIFPPPGVSVSVMPYRLDFSEVNQQLTYSVTFKPSNEDAITPEFVQGYLKWSSDKHFVRSPISVQLV